MATIGARIQGYKERAAWWGGIFARESITSGGENAAFNRARTAAHYGRKALALRATIKRPCECSDPGCPVHDGASCDGAARTSLRRVDMDYGRIAFCAACAEDAMDSGVFYR